MKLEDFLVPARFDPSCRPQLYRHVLAHLLFLSEEAHNETSRKWSLSQLYWKVAVDFLALNNVNEQWELNQVVPNVVR